MFKDIIKDDVLKIEKLLMDVLGRKDYVHISRMGGLTNHTYHITFDDADYAVRLPGEGTETLIVRKDEKVSTELACKLGIDANLIYFNENGAKISEYIADADTMSADKIKSADNIQLVAKVLKKLHTSGEDTKVPFQVFEMAEGYEKIITDKNVNMFEDYDYMKSEVMRIKSEIDSLIDIKKVPCHNDPLCENWVRSNEKMYLIDWEYAGMNDGMWDLADVSIEASFEESHDTALLREYLEREPEDIDRKHMLVNKIYVDYLWTLWAKARVPYDGQPMEDWAQERYARLKSFIEQYKKY